MDWLRLWHDMPNDPKWRTIARESGQALALVQAVYIHLLVDASMNETRGNSEVTQEDLASALDTDNDSIEAILKAMQGRVLDGSYLTGWERRQPKREDNSTDRVRRYREKRASKAKSDPPPDKEKPPCNAHETQRNAPEKIQIREDTEEKLNTIDPSHCDESIEKPKSAKKKPGSYPPEFELVWQAYPKRPGSNPKSKAFQAWNARIKEGEDPGKILQGTIRYKEFCEITGKAHTEYVMQAVRFFGKGQEYEQEWSPPEHQGPVSREKALELKNARLADEWAREGSFDRQFTDLKHARATFEAGRPPRHSGFDSRDYSKGLKEGVTDGEPNF